MTPSMIFPMYGPNSFLTDRGNEISTLDEKYRSIAELSSRALADRKSSVVSVTANSGKLTARAGFYVDCPSSMPTWIEPVLKQVGYLLTLQPNWDNDGAPSINPGAVQKALNALLLFMQDASPIPQLTPTRDGGVQLDWNEAGIALEIAFEPEEEGYAVFSDLSDSSTDWDGSILSKSGELTRLFFERLNRA